MRRGEKAPLCWLAPHNGPTMARAEPGGSHEPGTQAGPEHESQGPSCLRCHCCLPGCTPGNRNWERSLDCNPGLAQEAGMLAGIFTALASGCSWEDHKSGFFSSVLQSKVVKRATSTSPALRAQNRAENPKPGSAYQCPVQSNTRESM